MSEASVPLSALDAALLDRDSVDLSWIQPPPVSNGWTLAPDALKLISRLVEYLRPAHILEFGSGLSTRALVRACVSVGKPCAISAIDHDPEFGALSDELRAELREPVTLQHQLAPVVARDMGGKFLPVYLLDSEKLACRKKVDLVIVDGPPITLGGREGILYQILDLSRAGTLLLLDDAKRKAEKQALAHWKDNLGDNIYIRHLEGFSKGLAAVVIRKPLELDALTGHKFAIAKATIESIVPEGATFVVAQTDHWGTWSHDRRAETLMSRGGVPWGAPPDGASAVAALTEHVRRGATHLVFPWPEYWWFDHYCEFLEYIRGRYMCIVENDQLVVFDLRRIGDVQGKHRFS